MLPASSPHCPARLPRFRVGHGPASVSLGLVAISLLLWLALATVAQAAAASTLPSSSATQSAALLRAQTEDWLQTRHPWQGTDYQVTITAEPLDARLRLPACASTPELTLPAGQRIGARTTVMAACSAPSPWRLLLPVRINAQARALVARQAIAAGTALRPELFEVSWRDVATLSQGHVPPDALNGLESRLLIAGGSILTRALVKPETLVRRGQQVLLRVNNAALSISMAGEALSDGGLGERIKVRNLSSQKVLEGAVEADGSVSMAF